MLTAIMSHNRAVELLCSCCGLPPLEKHHAIRTVRDGLHAMQTQPPRSLMGILWHPIDLAGALLHDQVGLPSLQGAHQIVRHGNIGWRVGNLWVHIKRNTVHMWRPGEGINWLESNHKIGGEWNVWRQCAQDLGLEAITVQQRVGHEAPVVEALSRVMLG